MMTRMATTSNMQFIMSSIWNGMVLSIVSISDENRLRILPVGLESKKVMALCITLSNSSLWMCFEADAQAKKRVSSFKKKNAV